MPQKKKETKSQTPVAPSLNGLATRDNLLHGKLIAGPVPSHKDTRISDRKSWKPTGGHPEGVSEGVVEQAVKMMGNKQGNLVENDNPYLEQYFHPDQDILERQDLRPTITSGKNENLPYRKLALDAAGESTNWDRVSHNLAGLGNYKVDGTNPNYDSVYDEWDFDTKTPLLGKETILPSIQNYIAKTFMKNAGTPYAVYDRVPKYSLRSQRDLKGLEIKR